jgi:hypothetical protein
MATVGITGPAKGERSHGLSDATNFILSAPESAARRLALADKFMQAYVDDPASFVLPSQYRHLKPIIDAYALDLEGFVHYLLGVRDSFDKDSLAFERVQTLYRRVMGRHTQQVRRERADRAIAKAHELYGPVSFHKRLQWQADLEHWWAQRRLEYLAKARAKTENNRLSSDERNDLLVEFWYAIDTEINEGNIPPWS